MRVSLHSQRFERNQTERATTVVSLAAQHGIAGFDITPMEDDQIEEFATRLTQEARKAETEVHEIKVILSTCSSIRC